MMMMMMMMMMTNHQSLTLISTMTGVTEEETSVPTLLSVRTTSKQAWPGMILKGAVLVFAYWPFFGSDEANALPGTNIAFARRLVELQYQDITPEDYASLLLLDETVKPATKGLTIDACVCCSVMRFFFNLFIWLRRVGNMYTHTHAHAGWKKCRFAKSNVLHPIGETKWFVVLLFINVDEIVHLKLNVS